MNWLHEDAEGVVLTIKVMPRARVSAFAGVNNDQLRVRLKAPPVDGKANAELLVWLAAEMGVGKRAVELITGLASRVKRVRIRGVTAAQVKARLPPA